MADQKNNGRSGKTDSRLEMNKEGRARPSSRHDVAPSMLYRFSIPLAGFAILDIGIYCLSQGSDQAITVLIATGIYAVLTALSSALIPLLVLAEGFFWTVRILERRIDPHTWVNLALTVLALIWAIAKWVFWTGEF